MRFLVLPFLWAALASSIVIAQEPVYSETGILFPAPGFITTTRVVFGLAVPLNVTKSIKVTLDATPCDAYGTVCNDNDNSTYVSVMLYCGAATQDNAEQSLDFISFYPGRRQEIIIPPISPIAYPQNDTSGYLRCMAMTPNYNPTPLKLEFAVTEGNNITAMVEGEQEAARKIYEQCCGAQGSCGPWNQATEAAGFDYTKGEVFTDLCNIDNNACNTNGSLTFLYMDGYGLNCDVTALDFSNFTSLEYMSFTDNDLEGDFEAFAQNLSVQVPNLKLLDLGKNNKLTGELDTTAAGGICSLVKNGIEWLGIYGSTISGQVPDCMFDADSKLVEFLGEFSSISGPLPETLSSSTSIAVLTLGFTNISGPIPNLPVSLVKLNLSMSAHDGPLPDFSAPQYLTSVDLSNNQLTGPVPDAIVDHPTLRHLDLSANNLEALPKAWLSEEPSLNNLPPLDTLYLGNNQLNSPFPAALVAYPNLTVVDLSNTGITGSLPEVLVGGFPRLAGFRAPNNDLSGSIPESWKNANIFDTTNIDPWKHQFIVSNNSLSGDIPAYFAGPFYDTTIDLSGNDFSNGCEPEFSEYGACDDSAQSGSGDAGAGGGSTSGDASENGGDGGLSGGAVAAIVIVVLLVAGAVGFVVYKRRQRLRAGGNRFQRFEDDLSLEMGNRPSSNVYNPQLAP